MTALYPHLLGEAFGSLHPHVQRAHQAPLSAEGLMDVTHGRHHLVPILVGLLHLPLPGAAQDVRLRVEATGTAPRHELRWRRRIGDITLDTRQSARGTWLVERSGVGAVSFAMA